MPFRNKKIAMIIAKQDFRDEEYFIPRSIFLNEGAKVVTFSTEKGQALGTYGGLTDVDLLLDDLKVADFDALLFIGGAGAAKFIDNEQCHQLAQEAVEQGKVLGAICIAPAILAKAGVLQGKKATVWFSPMDKSAVKILKEAGAEYLAKPVIVEGKIITADGPLRARQFAEAIVRSLS